MKYFKIAIITLIFLITFSITTFAKTCFLGDSRTVGMKQSIDNDKDLWCCKVGEGHKYFINNCSLFLYYNNQDIDKIVCLFGVNDLYNKEKYVRTLNELADSTAISIYFVSVNPVVDKKSKYVKNSEIIEFNAYCKKMLNKKITYIDTFNNIKFNSVDGVHYNKETYISIYNYINDFIQ